MFFDDDLWARGQKPEKKRNRKKETEKYSLTHASGPIHIYNPTMAMWFSAMFTYQLKNTKM